MQTSRKRHDIEDTAEEAAPRTLDGSQGGLEHCGNEQWTGPGREMKGQLNRSCSWNEYTHIQICICNLSECLSVSNQIYLMCYVEALSLWQHQKRYTSLTALKAWLRSEGHKAPTKEGNRSEMKVKKEEDKERERKGKDEEKRREEIEEEKRE